MYWNLSRKSNLSISSSDGKQCFRYGKICCYRRKVWCDSNSKISGRELALGIILSALQEYVSLNKHGRQWETLSECCCHRKAWAASAQSFTLWQQATMEITRRDHSIIACFVPQKYGCWSSCTSCSWWITHSTVVYIFNVNRQVATVQRKKRW